MHRCGCFLLPGMQVDKQATEAEEPSPDLVPDTQPATQPAGDDSAPIEPVAEEPAAEESAVAGAAPEERAAEEPPASAPTSGTASKKPIVGLKRKGFAVGLLGASWRAQLGCQHSISYASVPALTAIPHCHSRRLPGRPPSVSRLLSPPLHQPRQPRCWPRRSPRWVLVPESWRVLVNCAGGC